MKIKFENVGRFNKTWTAEYPIDVPLATAVDDTKWWKRQLLGAVHSDLDLVYSDNDDCVYIMTGFRPVGRAVVATDEEGGAQ